MRKLRIGYVPYSSKLTHPGDRRRLVYWARKRGHELILDSEIRCDVIFKTVRADLNFSRISQNKTPFILDLVDGYLGSESNWRDWLRGAGKVVTGQMSGPIKPFSEIIKIACNMADAVVCETPEQVDVIKPFCENVHPILDFHEEFPFLPFKSDPANIKSKSLIWEGLPYTAKGLLQLNNFFSSKNRIEDISLEMVTDLNYPTFLGKYIPRRTSTIVKDIKDELGSNFQLTKWSLKSVVEASQRAEVAVLPLDPKGFLNPLKAENRLLIMWRLGLPTLTSPSNAYCRVMSQTGIHGICDSEIKWTEKLNFLLESKEIQANMVSAGQQYVRDTHSEELVLRAWDQLFESVL